MDLTTLFEVVGTIAFAFSGAFVAIECRLDMFGILVSAVVTATGGGMTRDILLGNTPPLMFRDPTYVILAVIIAFLTAVLYVPLVRWHFRKYVMLVIDVLDAIGLSVFTVVGMNTAMNLGFADNAFLVCAVGVISAVGGGVIRDLFVSRQPVIMKKEIYATASIIGSILYYFAHTQMDPIAAGFIAMGLIFIIRMHTLSNNINLPYARADRN